MKTSKLFIGNEQVLYILSLEKKKQWLHKCNGYENELTLFQIWSRAGKFYFAEVVLALLDIYKMFEIYSKEREVISDKGLKNENSLSVTISAIIFVHTFESI